jgi:stage IV sporulation protein FB
MANKLGYRVIGIDIDIFSGTAKIESRMHERDSVKITVAGPMVNLILCLVFFPLTYLELGDIMDNLVNIIYVVNGILLISNILPIYPTDGGQILRDILIIKNRRTAIKISCIVTIVFSSLVAIVGLIFGHWIVSIFAAYFGYLAIKELNGKR